MPKLEYDFAMTCEGCSKAAQRNLAKIGVNDVEADLANKKLYVTTDIDQEKVLEALKKTGKEVSLSKVH
ncbi:DgyrCDS3765 [Dimorphilus gyrociliatus]|uniref:Copper transport protein ATOX1 n=1 Tax=Dimorphilus gyrociliatus TaxID=2664684 RepID=A0A7I8VFG4_9ANNE|nr:DgyrCDS3765 [Dimorphilus gyrociliatus]